MPQIWGAFGAHDTKLNSIQSKQQEQSRKIDAIHSQVMQPQQTIFPNPDEPTGTFVTIKPDVTVSNASLTYTIPSDTKYFKIRSLFAVFSASATTGNRTLYFQLLDAAGNTFYETRESPAIVAGGIGAILAAPGVESDSSFDTNNNSVRQPLPFETVLRNQWQVNVTATAPKSGDKFTNFIIWGQYWLA